ncbi:MAG: helix-turn-helix domain-containing GNAT family N-acetyltransferase [Cohaesibacter sp.]|jgi:DNA-binding MarR family transcriptional regulator/GNAT superfamily N-acetyltransferase|nr:helix-turn-helix domain-containing GNAT family N-acetyltransferase [Cohaesibacter sp.]
MSQLSSHLSGDRINHIRAASRLLVRELGVLDKAVAGTDLSLSGVHTILEIGMAGKMKARDLSLCLRLEKSTISRLVKSLEKKGMLERVQSAKDAREQDLSLTAQGCELFDHINQFAINQVTSAIGDLEGNNIDAIASALSLYAQSLKDSRLNKQGVTDQKSQAPSPHLAIQTGYMPGILGQVTDLHARFYHRFSGFDHVFEATVASGMADFLPRLQNPLNQIWSIEHHGKIVGSISLDGEDLGDNIGHLRWFIMDDNLRGTGLGKQLFEAAVAFGDEQGFDALHLWTFKGLDAARSLYERYGFELVEEYPGSQWGKEVMEQKFIRARPI